MLTDPAILHQFSQLNEDHVDMGLLTLDGECPEATRQPRRHQMRKAARQVSAKAWLDSGAHITKPKADQAAYPAGGNARLL
jgi:hypothetical protein